MSTDGVAASAVTQPECPESVAAHVGAVSGELHRLMRQSRDAVYRSLAAPPSARGGLCASACTAAQCCTARSGGLVCDQLPCTETNSAHGHLPWAVVTLYVASRASGQMEI